MMLARSPHAPGGHRRGAILLVTLTLVALFAVVALSFALYGESQATWSRLNRESIATNDNPPSAAAMANLFLGRFIYPMDPQSTTTYGTTANALLNGIRGYDMATMVYGFHPNGGNNVPYNGIGTVFEDLSTNMGATSVGITDRRQVVNYSWQFDRSGAGNNRVFDPEFLGVRSAATTVPATAYVGRNAPYTYPDRNNLYVAVQDPISGRIIKVSYVSPHFNGGVYTAPDTTPPVDRRLAPPMSVSLGSNNGLSAANDDWLNAAGRYKSIRPRPIDHSFDSLDGRGAVSDFPFPPANPDGTYTGDVQNIPNTEGIQRNDAIWTNVGLPVTRWRDKNIIALVAPTILPLDGRVNTNVAGNLMGGSSQGFGPWEIGLARVFPSSSADPGQLISTRMGSTNPSPRGASGVTSYPFPSVPQTSALVNWDGGGASSAPTIPTSTTTAYATQPYSNPTYPNPGYGDATESTGAVPQMFNPYSWNAFTSSTPKLFSFADLRRSAVKYSGRVVSGVAVDYTQPYFLPPSTGLADLNQTGTSAGVNAVRARVTTTSNSIARAQLQPNYRDYAGDATTNPTGRTLMVNGTALAVGGTNIDDLQLRSPYTSANTGTAGSWATDFTQDATATTINRYRSAMAAIGPVNLNRTLFDYRTDTTKSLADPVNAGTPMAARLLQASTERNQLAREVFIRLIAAVGAKANITGPTTVNLPNPAAGYALTVGTATATATAADYDVLRYLAQIAANIVDLVDNDDISTPFVWNPLNTAMPFDPTNFSPTELPNRVVYGVEKPRVVINEAYSEVTNDPSDRGKSAASQSFRVKFWLELLNTGNTDTFGSPLGGIPNTADTSALAGNVPFSYNVMTPPMTAPYTFAPAPPVPYRVQVFQSGSTAVTDLSNPQNITGTVSSTMPNLQVDSPTFVNATPSYVYSIEPNNGQPQAAGSRNGIAVVGPDVPADPAMKEYAPTNATMLKDNDSAGVRMYYTIPVAMDANYKTNVLNVISNHTVVLQRLANPYVPSDPTNPYLTVDYMTHVHSEDGVQLVQSPGGVAPGTRSATTPTAIENRVSVGRIQPYMGAEGPVGMNNKLPTTYATSCVVSASQPMPAPMPLPQQPVTSLFRHNSQNYPSTMMMSSDNMIRLPFEWMPHFDRPLVNSIELLHAAVGRTDQVTHQFATIGATPVANQHTVPWTSAAAPLYRALELLSVKPWGYGLPEGGRVPGKININMIWDQSVLEALLDQSTTAPNNANSFQGSDVTSLLNGIFFSPTADSTQPSFASFARTKSTASIGSTVDEVGPTYVDGTITRGADRPFKPLGTATFAATATPPPPGSLLPSGSGIADTILRMNTTTGAPAIYRTSSTIPPAMTPSQITHPYLQAEMLGKMYNNITTTSDTYLVVMTVGYFEVRNNGPYDTTNPPVLGKEVFSDIPGDLRAKFVAVVDRSMIAAAPVAPTTVPVTATPTAQQSKGLWFTETATSNPAPMTAPPVGMSLVQFRATGFGPHPKDTTGTINAISYVYEGRTYFLVVGPPTPLPPAVANDPNTTFTLVLGTGAAAQAVNVASLGFDLNNNMTIDPNEYFDSTTGIANVLVTGSLTLRPGLAVSNGISANPGPQPGFDIGSPQYQGVVPYFEPVTTGR
ncbi:hypothetical protein [Limnoglobus roseus]|uniref:Uncharacterized protein n=1 Tax=Limnoglobus roseus TaxID=2598579 RepID=A0A5C1AB37_9BACT|nr:hypothetical protein [Limnoglobus roseus]QEL15437.1 hypothetical protein PX52LOC_02356 [Limnoglobus roseus]